MRASIGFFAAATLLVSAPVLAETPESGWYVGVGVGETYFETNTSNGKAKDWGLGGSVLAGYKVNPYISWEGELTYSGNGTDTVDGLYSQTNYNSWNLGIVGSIPFANVFRVFGKFGATYGNGEYTIGNVKTTARDGGYTVGAGVGVQLNSLDLRFRYDLQRVRFDNTDVVDFPQRLGIDAIWHF
jgi:hypothetical protein